MLALLGAVAGLALAQQTDTTLAVQQGARLEVENFGGEIVVRTWTQNRVRVQANHSSRDYVDIRASARAVRVEAESRRGMPHLVDYHITVPTWMAVELQGVSTDMTVEGTEAAIRIETVEGDVRVTGGRDEVSLQSVGGSVTLSGSRARVEVSSVDGDLRLSEITGNITAETVDGSIVIEKAQADAVDANTVDGDILYVGAIRNSGRYVLTTHDGAVTVSIPEGTNATISVATFDGKLDASFPLQLRETRARRFSFTLGNGGARVELETFDGAIQLRRPNEIQVPAAGERVNWRRDRQRDRGRDEY